MSSAYANTSYANLGEVSPINNLGEIGFDVNYLPSSDGGSVESGYYADSEFIPASSELSPELGQDVYSDSHLGYDGSQVFPIYYPIPTYYQVYYGVSSVEHNGTTFYQYYPLAVPIYCLSSELTTENMSNSDVSSVSDEDDLTNEISENVNEDRDSSILIPENEFTVEERKNDVKRKKDWLYLLSLSGKLHVKDHIPEVHVMPEILEEDEDVEISEEGKDVEISEEILQSGDSLEKELWTDVIPEIDKSDDDQKNPKKDTIESCYAIGAHKEKCQASGEENDLWKDFFYSMDDPVFGIEASFNNVFENESCDRENAKKDVIESSYTNGAHKVKCQASEEENYLWDDFFCSIDDPVFGIEACFNNASEKESSSDKELDKKNFNLSSTYGKTFMILTRLNKQIEILPTIEEEEEGVVKSEKLDVMTEILPVKINSKKIKSHVEGCLKSEQQNVEKMENNCELPKATEEVDHSQKPTKKRFKRIRRFFSELRSCFRKSKDPAG